MEVTGGRTKKKYKKITGDTGRSFITPEGQTINESQMKALEGDWRDVVTGPSGAWKDEPGTYGRRQQFAPDTYVEPTPQPSLGSIKRLATPAPPLPTPNTEAGIPAPTPQKVSGMPPIGEQAPNMMDMLSAVFNQRQQQSQSPETTLEEALKRLLQQRRA